MTTDNRTNEQIVAEALREGVHVAGGGRSHLAAADVTYALGKAGRLVAAQEAAPQNNGKCGGCRDLGPHRNVPGCQYYEPPVLPSSDVDEDKLAEVKARTLEEAANDLRVSFSRGAAIAMHHQCHKKQCRCGNPGNDEIVRAVFEAAREELRARAAEIREAARVTEEGDKE